MMTGIWPGAVYILCLVTSGLCAILLYRAWQLSRSRLLLWTAIGFGFFALNNLALAADMVVFTATSLWVLRAIPNLIGVFILIGGFIWESDR